jgi:hypothetical protein
MALSALTLASTFASEPKPRRMRSSITVQPFS